MSQRRTGNNNAVVIVKELSFLSESYRQCSEPPPMSWLVDMKLSQVEGVSYTTAGV